MNGTRFEVDSTVDLLCTTKEGQQIAIEMQRAHESCFLARSQLYMSKLLASQVEIGQSSVAHKVMLDTYIICIGKENIIRDPLILAEQRKFLQHQDITKRDLSFELTVTPTIHDLWVTVQDNRMTWKFFELTKFKEFIKHMKIDHNSPIKHQWMHFLLKCQEADEEPEDIADIIKEGYEIMKMANWTPTEKVLYDMAIDKEQLAIYKAQEAGVKGEARGKAKGKAEGLAVSIRKALKYNEPDDEIINEHQELTAKKLSVIKALSEPRELADITKILLDIDPAVESEDDIDVAGEQSLEQGEHI